MSIIPLIKSEPLIQSFPPGSVKIKCCLNFVIQKVRNIAYSFFQLMQNCRPLFFVPDARYVAKLVCTVTDQPEVEMSEV